MSKEVFLKSENILKGSKTGIKLTNIAKGTKRYLPILEKVILIIKSKFYPIIALFLI